MQVYLAPGLCNARLARLIFKARTETLDIKTQKGWKYSDKLCVGCGEADESGDEILKCKVLNKETKLENTEINYKWFYSAKEKELLEVAVRLQRAMKNREKLIESSSKQ